MDNLPTQLISVIPTTSLAQEIVEDVEGLLDGKFKVKINPFEEMEKKLPYPVHTKILELYHLEKGNDNNPSQLYAFLEEIKKTLQNLPTLSLTIAVIPTPHMLEILSGWMVENMHEPYLLDITVKKNLLAGAAIGYEGKLKDYSLTKRIQMVKN